MKPNNRETMTAGEATVPGNHTDTVESETGSKISRKTFLKGIGIAAAGTLAAQIPGEAPKVPRKEQPDTEFSAMSAAETEREPGEINWEQLQELPELSSSELDNFILDHQNDQILADQYADVMNQRIRKINNKLNDFENEDVSALGALERWKRLGENKEKVDQLESYKQQIINRISEVKAEPWEEIEMLQSLHMQRYHQMLMGRIEDQKGLPRDQQKFEEIDDLARVLNYSGSILRPPSAEDIAAAPKSHGELKQRMLEGLNQRQQLHEAVDGVQAQEAQTILQIQDVLDTVHGISGNQITVRQLANGTSGQTRVAVSFQTYVTQADGTNWTQGVVWQKPDGSWDVYTVVRPQGQNMVFDPSVEVVQVGGQETLALVHSAVNQSGNTLTNSTVRRELIRTSDGQHVKPPKNIYNEITNGFSDYSRSRADNLGRASVYWLSAGAGFKVRRAYFDQLTEDFILHPQEVNPAGTTAQYTNGMTYTENGHTFLTTMDYTDPDGLIMVELDENGNKIEGNTITLVDITDSEKVEKHPTKTYRETSIGVGAISPDGKQIVGVIDVANPANGNKNRLKVEFKDRQGNRLNDQTIYIDHAGELLDPAIEWTDNGQVLIHAHHANGDGIFYLLAPEEGNTNLNTKWDNYRQFSADVEQQVANWTNRNYVGEQNDLIKIGPNTFAYFGNNYPNTGHNIAGNYPSTVQLKEIEIGDIKIYLPIIQNNN